MNMNKVGEQIAILRKQKGLTQSELGERLGVSFQAVSKWERGETLPDISLLVDLAEVLETTTDHILTGGERIMDFKRSVRVDHLREGIDAFVRLGELFGRDNGFYVGAVEGVTRKMNIDMEEYLKDPYTKEALIAEAALQCIRAGAYMDLSDIKKGFGYDHWRNTVLKYAKDHGIK